MKKYILLIAGALVIFGAVAIFRLSSGSATFLWELSRGGTWLLPLVAIAALIDSINPCAFSVLFLTIAFLYSIGRTKANIWRVSMAYVFGLFLVYMLIGLGLFQALHLFNTPHFMARLGAVLIIVLGLIGILGELISRFPVRLKIPDSIHRKIAVLMEKGSIPTAIALGFLVGLCEFPCSGGPYLLIIGLLNDSSTYTTGFGYLLLYNLIFVLPLILILGFAGDEKIISKMREWQKNNRRKMKVGGGLAMVALGLLILLI